jgi:uncharacterized protein YcnI
MNNNRLAIRMSAVAASCVAASFLFAGVSYAHVETEPAAVEAGNSATVSFSPSHGCDGSPTISLAFKMPGSVRNAAAVAKTGWETSTADGVITFSGGSLEATTVENFDITFTAPAAAGPIFFPVVQKCVKGEINWIDMPNPDGTEAEFAAPLVNVTAGPPTSADLVAVEADASGPSPADETESSNEIELSDNVAVGKDDDDDETSETVLIVLIAALGVALVVAGGVIYRKRADKDD